jgi:hypothetical protein
MLTGDRNMTVTPVGHGLRRCKRCSEAFRVTHGNQKLCGACRMGRTSSPLWGNRGATFGVRRCDRCWREYVARTENQRYCGPRCRWLARSRNETALYANPRHRGTRRTLAPLVATGTVRCARGPACRFPEMVDGELVGGLIRAGEPWHLGHPDGESVGGPEHVLCNTSAPSRLRSQRKRGAW